jgi:hypothetical protein
MTHSLTAVILADIGGLFLLPVGLLAIAFWIWMVLDCAKHEPDGNAKIVWLLIIVLAGVVGAPLYLFIRKMPRSRRAQYRLRSPVYQPWRKDERIR